MKLIILNFKAFKVAVKYCRWFPGNAELRYGDGSLVRR